MATFPFKINFVCCKSVIIDKRRHGHCTTLAAQFVGHLFGRQHITGLTELKLKLHISDTYIHRPHHSMNVNTRHVDILLVE